MKNPYAFITNKGRAGGPGTHCDKGGLRFDFDGTVLQKIHLKMIYKMQIEVKAVICFPCNTFLQRVMRWYRSRRLVVFV